MNHDLHKIKAYLYKICLDKTEETISAINKALKSIEEARNNETKSSAGDKYETGRAMMQIEEDNNSRQLIQAVQLKTQLQKIDLKKKSKKVELGSMVLTNRSAYFVSIGLGEIKFEAQSYYCISPASPIGLMLMDKKKGEKFEFRGVKHEITNIG